MKARAFPLAAACLLAITSWTAGQDVDVPVDVPRESLRQLDGLYLVIGLHDEVQEGGLTKNALETYLEMRLRQARIPVLSASEWVASERKPYLYLYVRALQTVREGWSYSLSLEVEQLACIQGGMEGQEGLSLLSGRCSLFTTWEVSGLYITPGNLAESVRGNLAELMDQLVNDYLTVNP